METTQINVPDPPDERFDCLTDETVQQIRFLFDVDHAFPQKLEHPGEEDHVAPRKGLLGRIFGWLLSGLAARRRNLAARFRTPPHGRSDGEGF